jgi:hypothetical protein
MVDLDNYDGPRGDYNYAVYDGRFWNKNVRQIKHLYHGVLGDISYIVDSLTLGVFSSLKEIIETEKYVTQLVTDLDKGPLPEVTEDIELIDSLVPIHTESNEDHGFIINGVNSTATIMNLQYLTGLPISELERRMLPDNRSFDELKKGEYFGSNGEGSGGFRKPGESLIEGLARNNDYVLGRDFTHQMVARPMLVIMNAIIACNKHRHKILRFNYKGEYYTATRPGFPMFQDSPYNDGISIPGFNIDLTKESTGETFFYAPLSAYLIARYGDYEGDVPYRTDPKKAIDFFYG